MEKNQKQKTQFLYPIDYLRVMGYLRLYNIKNKKYEIKIKLLHMQHNQLIHTY